MRSYNYNLYDKPIKATSESAEWIFLATNLGLEILSAACDQASSPTKPHYALFGMLLAIAAMHISVWELMYRGKKERVVLRRWGMLWWFYHPPPLRHTPFGTLPDIFGLVAGISQCICSIVQYVYYLRHVDNPFKASLLPAVFLICLGASKLSNNRMNANTTDNKDSWENSSSREETLWHTIAANITSLDDQEVEGNVEQQEEERLPRRLPEKEEDEQEWEDLERELERERLRLFQEWEEQEWVEQEWELERERERERLQEQLRLLQEWETQELEREQERLQQRLRSLLEGEPERLRLLQEWEEHKRLRQRLQSLLEGKPERLRLRLLQEWEEQERLRLRLRSLLEGKPERLRLLQEWEEYEREQEQELLRQQSLWEAGWDREQEQEEVRLPLQLWMHQAKVEEVDEQEWERRELEWEQEEKRLPQRMRLLREKEEEEERLPQRMRLLREKDEQEWKRRELEREQEDGALSLMRWVQQIWEDRLREREREREQERLPQLQRWHVVKAD